jgi:predicted MFS family arabinose efflux permease
VKKFLATLMMMVMMAVVIPFASATTANAQTRYRKPGIYQRHRNVINMGIGTAAGALLGGLIKGKKGAGWGALAGAGASAIYTYKIKPKQPRY